MKKNLLTTMIGAFALCASSLFAQEPVTIAAWDFEDGQGTATYGFWGTDDVWSTIRPWALNEYENKRDATFGAVYDGVSAADGEAIFANCSHTLVTTTTFGGYCLNASGNWDRNDDLGKSTRYWLMDNVSTVGLKNIVITLYMAGVGTQGPTEFKFGYKVGDGDWVDGDFKTIRSSCSATAPITETDLWTENVPAACDGQAKVAFRWVVGENMLSGAPLVSGSAVRVDKIAVQGTSDENAIINPKTEQLVYAAGSRLMSGADINVTVYNVSGVVVYKGQLLKGGSIELSKGIYIVKAATANNAESIKIVIE